MLSMYDMIHDGEKRKKKVRSNQERIGRERRKERGGGGREKKMLSN